jgi:CubicO group peptidase (beta-lactamase class C family)
VIVAGLALLGVLLTCSPLWQLQARSNQSYISAWRPTPGPIVAVARAGSLEQPRASGGPAPTAQPIVAVAVPTVAPTAIPPIAADLQNTAIAAAIDGYLNDLVNLQYFQGAVLVARDGRVILSKGYGMADAARGIANTPQTRFRLASVTKQFTATAIMLLQAQGKLAVGDSICLYLEPCPDAWRLITIEHLLTHTSGLPNYTDFGSYEPSQAQPTTPDELVARFRDQPLLFAPGSSYMYENSDYVLLGMIIERASGQR